MANFIRNNCEPAYELTVHDDPNKVVDECIFKNSTCLTPEVRV